MLCATGRLDGSIRTCNRKERRVGMRSSMADAIARRPARAGRSLRAGRRGAGPLLLSGLRPAGEYTLSLRSNIDSINRAADQDGRGSYLYARLACLPSRLHSAKDEFRSIGR